MTSRLGTGKSLTFFYSVVCQVPGCQNLVPGCQDSRVPGCQGCLGTRSGCHARCQGAVVAGDRVPWFRSLSLSPCCGDKKGAWVPCRGARVPGI